MTLRRAAVVGLVLASALAAQEAAAQARPPAQGQPQQQKEEKNFPKGSSWTLRSFNGRPVDRSIEATLKIDDQLRGSGFAGCNTFSATMWPVRGQRFAVGPMALTKKQCAQPLMAFERAYLAALHSSPTWDIVNGMLEVKGAAGSLAFARGF